MSTNVNNYRVEALQHTSTPPINRDCYFNDDDGSLIEELTQIIIRYNMEERFGINIINPNVPLCATETTLEQTDEENRISFTSKLNRDSKELENSRPTSWSFENGLDIYSAGCRGYCNYSDYKHSNLHSSNVKVDLDSLKRNISNSQQTAHSIAPPTDVSALTHIDEVSQITKADESVLKALRDAIVIRGQNHRVGVFLVHKHFDLSDTEVLLEKHNEKTDETIVFSVDTSIHDVGLLPSALIVKKLH